jgi:hypothetical protein
VNQGTERQRPPAGWTCAWPECRRVVGESRAFCRAHWPLVPKGERWVTVAAVFRAREREVGGKVGDVGNTNDE